MSSSSISNETWEDTLLSSELWSPGATADVTYIHTYSLFLSLCTHTYTHTDTQTHTHTLSPFVCTHTHTHTHIHWHTYTHIHWHTYTHCKVTKTSSVRSFFLLFFLILHTFENQFELPLFNTFENQFELPLFNLSQKTSVLTETISSMQVHNLKNGIHLDFHPKITVVVKARPLKTHPYKYIATYQPCHLRAYLCTPWIAGRPSLDQGCMRD